MFGGQFFSVASLVISGIYSAHSIHRHRILEITSPAMFAVPGWSVSASALKTQLNLKVQQPDRDSKVVEKEKKSRKRKRGHGSGRGIEVTEENLGDLWKKHIEGGGLSHSESKIEESVKRDKKKRKSEKESTVYNVLEGAPDANGDLSEGLVEKGGTTKPRLEETPAVVEKKGKQKRQSLEQGTVTQANGHVSEAEDPPKSIECPNSPEGSKAKFERRKAKAAKKREAKALLQANGTLPPTRPEAKANIAKVPKPKVTHPSNPSESSKPPDTQHESPSAICEELPNSSDLPKPARDLQSSNPSPPNSQLTPLQQRMTAKLTSSRFRHLNEILYTSPSDQAMRLFTESPQNYTSYHAGFRAQVAVWPQNPVDGLIEDVKTRGRFSVPSQKKLWRDQKKGKKPKESSSDAAATNGEIVGKADPLPRTKGTCTIADLGCGDAHFAASLHPLRTSLNLNLLSFDLAKGDTPNAHLIIIADISNLRAVGIRDSSVDIAICCLSLMNTNWVSFVDECSRIVRGGGEVWVAEIKSRFARPEHNGKKKGDGIGKKKKKTKIDDEDETADLAMEELEETKGPKDETDVTAFVEVFRKRGFNLKGEPDMANKMFVRMRFTKSLRPENEKGGAAKFGDGFRGKQVKTKFLEDEERVVDESKVLKPCVYKVR